MDGLILVTERPRKEQKCEFAQRQLLYLARAKAEIKRLKLTPTDLGGNVIKIRRTQNEVKKYSFDKAEGFRNLAKML